MYRALKIQDFRGFDRIVLSGLGRMNLFIGPNGAGKTSALEAVFLHACGPNLLAFVRAALRSRMGKFIDHVDIGEGIRSLFRLGAGTIRLEAELTPLSERTDAYFADWASAALGPDGSLPFRYEFLPTAALEALYPGKLLPPTAGTQLRQVTEGGGSFSLDAIGTWRFSAGDASLSDEPAVKRESLVFVPVVANSFGALPVIAPDMTPYSLGVWLDPVSHRQRTDLADTLVALLRANRLGELESLLRCVMPSLTKLEVIPLAAGGGSSVYLTQEGLSRLEVSCFGDGLKRWLNLYATMLRYPRAIFAVDEIDAGLHPYLERDTTKLMLELLKTSDSQMFATTHSMEFIDALLRSSYGHTDDPPQEAEDPIVVFTLRRDDEGRHRVRRRTGWQAWRARQEVAAELRE